IDADNADALFDAAVDQLLLLQALPCPPDLPVYDESMLARELHLFDQWYLDRHLGIKLDDDERRQLEQVYRHLTDAALAQPRVFLHRDFMPRNPTPVPVNARSESSGPA